MSFAHLTLATRNVQDTVNFYERALGWKRLEMPENTPIEAVWLDIGNGGQIHVLGIDDFEISAHEKEFGRHLAVFYPGSEFDGLRKRLNELGSEVIDPIRPTPFERFFFKDPNGYMIEVVDSEHWVVEK